MHCTSKIQGRAQSQRAHVKINQEKLDGMRHGMRQSVSKYQIETMTNAIFAAILFTTVQFTSLINAQEFSLGKCPPFPTVKNFDPERVS